MINNLILRFIPFIFFAVGLRATAPLSPAEQIDLYNQLAAKTYRAELAQDADGNIIFIGLNQANIHKKDNPDAPGISDEDMALLARFPKLQGLTLPNQPLTDAGYAQLANLPNLRIASIGNIMTNKAAPTKATSRAITYLDGARNLEVLDLTHTFGMEGDPPVLQDMQGFPELKVLIVDVGLSNDFDEFFPFVQKSPKLERLKLHRCNFSEKQMAQILDALPNLKVLEMKPSGNTPGKRWSYTSLKLVAEHPNIEVLRLIQKHALPLPWENGLEHLVAAKNLKVFVFPNHGYQIRGVEDRVVAPADLERLRAARPDLTINPPGPTADLYRHINPVSYDWDIGPR